MIKMKDSGVEWIGQIPDDWNLERLQWHLYEIVEKNDPIQTTQVLSLTNKKGVIPYEEKGNQGNTAKEYYDGYKIAYPDTIVANSMNILIGSVGYSKLYGCVSPVYYVFKEKNNNDLRFINYIMQTSQFQRELRKCANGILEIRLRVSASDILKQKCAFPNIQTQTLIADYLDEKCLKIDRIIEKQQAVIEKLKEYKLSVITEAVTKGLNPDVEMKDSEIEWIGTIPDNWELVKAKYSVYISHGSDPKSEGEIPVYGSGANSFRTCGEFKEGPTVLIGRKGALHIPNYIEGRYWNVDTAFDVKVKENYNLKFYYYNAICFDYKFYMSQTTLPGMTQENYKNMYITKPSITEQNKIVNFLDKKCSDIEKIIKQKQAIIDKTISYKKSLIYEVVTGKKVV